MEPNMKVLVRGLKAGLDEAALREALARYAKIRSLKRRHGISPASQGQSGKNNDQVASTRRMPARPCRRAAGSGRGRRAGPA
ncbi:hypothetical protein CNECB9_2260045 [Cupriavidus necator]|uniref:Uncharacterized protein n=1 Tax=Cupriavidus necator TaxID=106590 RepID=A0A1K0IQM1_CUPNE|nr:hypothetical protein CNECB9_2260045 [Cupriavidus necator]